MSKSVKINSRRKFLVNTSILGSGFFLGAPILGAATKSIQNDSRPDYFVLISDTHIDQNPNRLRHGSNMFYNLETTLSRIMDNPEGDKPQGVIILGDIANTDGYIGEYGLSWSLLRHLEKEDIPIHFAMGNHDNRENFYTVFPNQKPENPLFDGKHLEIVEARHTIHIILDTLARVDEYITGGELGEEQLLWLDDTLARNTHKPIILHGHHYPWHNVQDGNIRGMKDYQELIRLTYKYPHVKAYIFGHSHRFDPDPYNRITIDHKRLNMLNVPTLAGHGGEQPVGYLHAYFYSDRAEYVVECIDTLHQMHGHRVIKKYRS